MQTFKKNTKPNLSLLQSFMWIVMITLFVSGGSTLFILYYKYQAKLKLSDDNYRILALVQSCPTKERLKNVHLTEILGLSVDQPTNLYSFSIPHGLNCLSAYSLIKYPTIKKVSPGTLFVDYQLRQPVAFLGNFTNSTFDEEGIIFPFEPFFSPKKLPKLYLDRNVISSHPYGKMIDHQLLSMFHLIKKHLENEEIGIDIIDLSKINMESVGQREIILQLSIKRNAQLLFVRMNSRKLEESLMLFKKIFPFLRGDEKIIDLRLDFLIYIKRN